jgi:ACS family hexuronate transporter-like MFS transporter
VATLERRQAWAVTLTVTAAMSISYVDRQTLSVLAPTVTKVLAIGDAAYGWLGSAFSVAYLVGGPFAGALVDRLGARRSLPGAIALWSIVAALHAVAPGFGTLLGLRLALGLAESPSFPAGAQVVQRVLSPADRARGMSLLFVGMSLGSMIAPPIAIALATRVSWRAGFAGTAAIAALWLPLWAVVTRSPVVRRALDQGLTDPASGSRNGAGPLGVRPRRLDAAFHPAMLRGLVGLLAVVPLSAFMATWEAKFYVRQVRMDQASLAPYLMASAFLFDAGALLFGDLASRGVRVRGDAAPPRLLFATGAFLAAAGMATLAVAHTPVVVLIGMGLGGVGRGAVVTLTNSDTLGRMPPGMVSAAAGVIASVQSLGAIVVNPIVGAVVSRHSYEGVVLALAAWAVILALAWLAWPAPRPQTSP